MKALSVHARKRASGKAPPPNNQKKKAIVKSKQQSWQLLNVQLCLRTDTCIHCTSFARHVQAGGYEHDSEKTKGRGEIIYAQDNSSDKKKNVQAQNMVEQTLLMHKYAHTHREREADTNFFKRGKNASLLLC